MWPFLGQEQHTHPQPGVPPLWFFGVRASAGSLTVGREHRLSLWKANLKQVSVHPAFLDCLWLCFMSWLSGNLLLCNSPEVASTSELGLCLARLGRASGIQQCLLNVIYAFTCFSLILQVLREGLMKAWACRIVRDTRGVADEPCPNRGLVTKLASCRRQHYGRMQRAGSQWTDGGCSLTIMVAISDKFIYELLREENSLAWGEWKSSLREWNSKPRPAPGAEYPSGESSQPGNSRPGC